jgi:hypothetical protein
MVMGGAGKAFEKRAGRVTFEASDPELEARPMTMAMVEFGDDPKGPCAVFFNLQPNLEFAAHYHNTEQCFVLLEGSIRIGRTWYGPGSFRIQDSGSVYGPLLSGPEGCKAVSFYGDRSELPDQFASEKDKQKSDELIAKLIGMMQTPEPVASNP